MRRSKLDRFRVRVNVLGAIAAVSTLVYVVVDYQDRALPPPDPVPYAEARKIMGACDGVVEIKKATGERLYVICNETQND